ncbi:MAG: glycosyltransferase family 2 protein [Bacteroidota bacterium]|nr:glycosyltransferase family 2 protein [Bacteroidota bacterium]
MQTLTIITPVYNEEGTLFIFHKHLMDFGRLLDNYKIQWIIVDDGSTDATPFLVKDLVQNNLHANSKITIKAYILSRNFGKEAALFAGLSYSEGDIVVPMDIDLQDPFEVIFRMIEKYEQGAEVVLAKRLKRRTDTFFKRMYANLFYKLNNKVSSIKLEENVGDFRLMTQRVVTEIVKLSENQLFMKGLMSWVGFKTEVVTYERPLRIGGRTKFNFLKLWELALQGITSFSTIPLKVWTYFGGFISLISFVFGIKIIIQKLFFGISITGYASLMVAILFLGGVQLIGIGILGEYLGRTYLESKRRPKYIVREIVE